MHQGPADRDLYDSGITSAYLSLPVPDAGRPVLWLRVMTRANEMTEKGTLNDLLATDISSCEF